MGEHKLKGDTLIETYKKDNANPRVAHGGAHARAHGLPPTGPYAVCIILYVLTIFYVILKPNRN